MALVDNITALDIGGDRIRAIGLVDGVEYRVEVWKSHCTQLVNSTPGTPAAKKTAVRQYLAQQLKAAAVAAAAEQAPPSFDVGTGAITV